MAPGVHVGCTYPSESLCGSPLLQHGVNRPPVGGIGIDATDDLSLELPQAERLANARAVRDLAVSLKPASSLRCWSPRFLVGYWLEVGPGHVAFVHRKESIKCLCPKILLWSF